MKSLWLNNIECKTVPLNIPDISCDVCIIGGGIFGVSCAYYLSKFGFKVILLEKDKIASKTTGHTTGKITSQHGLFYKHLIDDYGYNFARLYLQSNEEAIQNIKNIIDAEKISCDFSFQNNYIYATTKQELLDVKSEINAVRSLNFPCEFATKVGLPFDTLGSICFKNQAQFNPVKYVYGLCNSFGNFVKIFNNTTVTDICRDGNNYICFASNSPVDYFYKYDKKSTNYKIKSKYVIMASHYPFIKFPGFYFTKMYQSTSYVIAIDPKKTLFNGMFLSAGTPSLSFRTAKYGNKNLLLIAGSDHKTGSYCTDASSYKVLEDVAHNYYPNCEILYRWNTRDCISLDKIPYVGLFSNSMPNLYIGTGFKKWGMTLSNVASNIIVDMITNKHNSYCSLYSSDRFNPIKNKDEFKNVLVQSAKSLVIDKIKKVDLDFSSIPLNSGGIIEINNQKVGIFRDYNDNIFALKPFCTHLGCLLSWNDVDKSWDCPCHGSRFNFDGKNLYDPAFKDLEIYNLD